MPAGAPPSTGASMACRRPSSIGRDGRIAYKFIGPIDAQGLKQRLLPEIEKAKAAPAS